MIFHIFNMFQSTRVIIIIGPHLNHQWETLQVSTSILLTQNQAGINLSAGQRQVETVEIDVPTRLSCFDLWWDSSGLNSAASGNYVSYLIKAKNLTDLRERGRNGETS